MPSLRLFIAFDSPPAVKRQAMETIGRLRTVNADVSWEKNEEKLHCTIKFLGSTDEKLLPELQQSLQDIGNASPPFSVRYNDLGYFGERRHPKVLWVGIENTDGLLAELYKKIDASMELLGFQREERVFHPHLTLGRVRSSRNAEKLIETLESLTFQSDVFAVLHCKLMRSELKPSGSVYAEQMSIPLVGKSR